MYRFWSCLTAIAVALLASGCGPNGLTHSVTVYQPLTSLQKPTAIRTSETNFSGQRMLIRCIPGGALTASEAQRLCSKMSALFSNQGAQVDVAIPRAGGGGVTELVAGARPDLVMELSTRLLNFQNPPFMWVACVASCGVIPAYTDVSVAQDISIRDAEGFELASDSLQARFVEYHGLGIWAVNRSLDLLVREKSEHLTGDSAKEDFSRDFYRQINQLAFNAKVRAAVLRNFEPPPASAKKAQP